MVVDVWNKSCKKNCEFYSKILCIVVSLRHTIGSRLVMFLVTLLPEARPKV